MIALGTRALPTREASLAALLETAREFGFDALVLAAKDTAPPPGPLAAARARTGVRIAALRAGCLETRTAARRPTEELGSRDEARRERAIASVREHAAFAKSIGCPRIVLEGGAVEGAALDERVKRLEGEVDRGAAPGELLEEIKLLARRDREAHLERLCRSLHAIVRPLDDLRFSLLPATRPHEILDLESMRDALADLHAPNLDVWFDAGRARAAEHLGGEPSVAILSAWAPRLAGIDLHDSSGLREHLRPGDGEVDWRMVAELVPRTALRVIDLEMGTSAATLRESRRLVESMGLA